MKWLLRLWGWVGKLCVEEYPMKLSLIAFALLPLSASALEVGDVQLVRMFNGQNYQCKETWELGKPSYQAAVQSAQASAEQASLNLHVQFQLCGGSKDSQSWSARKPLDSTFNTDSDGNPVRIDYSEPEFVFSSELGSADPLVVSVPNAADQTISVQLPLASGLSAEQRDSLAAGSPYACARSSCTAPKLGPSPATVIPISWATNSGLLTRYFSR